MKRLNKEWLRVGDEPLQPYTVEHQFAKAGERLLNPELRVNQPGRREPRRGFRKAESASRSSQPEAEKPAEFGAA